MCSADWQPGIIKVRPGDAQAEVTPRCLHTLPASASQGACLFPSRSVALLKAAVKDQLRFRKGQVLPGGAVPGPPKPAAVFQDLPPWPSYLKIDPSNVLDGIPELFVCRYFHSPSSSHYRQWKA